MTINKERHETFLDFEMRKYYHQVKKPSETSKKYIWAKHEASCLFFIFQTKSTRSTENVRFKKCVYNSREAVDFFGEFFFKDIFKAKPAAKRPRFFKKKVKNVFQKVLFLRQKLKIFTKKTLQTNTQCEK